MKILMVLRSMRSGGAENHVLMLMRALRTAGHEAHYAGPVRGWLAQELAKDGFHVFDLPMRGTYDLFSIWRLSRYAQRIGADIIHGHLTRGAFYTGWASRLSCIPNIATAHSDNAGKHFGRANKIIAVSHAVARFLTTCGYKAERIQVIHHGIPDPLATASPKASPTLSVGDNGLYTLLMVARIVPAKGHDTALHAMAHLKHLPVKLLLAGDPHAGCGPDMVALSDALGLAGRVEFLGHRTDVTALMLNANLLLAPSRREALSLTLIEAAACSLPVIASRVGGIPEVVQDGQTGCLVPVDDPMALAQTVEKLLAQPDSMQSLGQRARHAFESSFTEKSMLNATLTAYFSIVGGKQHA